MLEQNCKNTTARKSQKKPEKARKSQKKPEKARKSQKQEQRWVSCLKDPTFYQKCQLVKLAQKSRKTGGGGGGQLFQTNLDLN